MTLLEALILGLVQGISEFLPISSSTHLRLARSLLGLSENGSFPYFDLICHAGTMCALLIGFRKEIFLVLKSFRLIALFILALCPLVPAYLLIKRLHLPIHQSGYIGYGLLITAALLWLATRREKKEAPSRWKWTDVLWIGIMQTFAFIPGVSRSGSTIAAARFCGWAWLDAARFSFLLAIPTILGGSLLETLSLLHHEPNIISALPLGCYVAGFISSFLFGLLGLQWMFRLYEKANVQFLIGYCALLGLFLTLGIWHA